jgi:hypothetical protein
MNGCEGLVGGGTWSREARRVAMLAAELELGLDQQALILCDVRDLIALRQLLQRAARGETWRSRQTYGVLAGHGAPAHNHVVSVLAQRVAHALGRRGRRSVL